MDELPDVLTLEQAAGLMRVSVNTMYAEVRAGRIAHVRIGRSIRISKALLVAHLCGQEPGQVPLTLFRGSAGREGSG